MRIWPNPCASIHDETYDHPAREEGYLLEAATVKPFVSIVIPTYNCPYIPSSIESALSQTYPHKEVIVVNDGSTNHADKIKPYLDRIRYIEKANGGTGSALNSGIRQAQGDYIAWLSSDDLFTRNKVETQLAFMLARHAVASYTAFYQINEHNQITGRFGTGFSDKTAFYRAMKQGNVINGCTVMLKKSVFEHAGFFDESLKGTQDYDLWCRVMQHDDFLYLDEPLVKYRVHSGMSTKKLGDILSRERFMIQRKYSESLDRLINQNH